MMCLCTMKLNNSASGSVHNLKQLLSWQRCGRELLDINQVLKKQNMNIPSTRGRVETLAFRTYHTLFPFRKMGNLKWFVEPDQLSLYCSSIYNVVSSVKFGCCRVVMYRARLLLLPLLLFSSHSRHRRGETSQNASVVKLMYRQQSSRSTKCSSSFTHSIISPERSED
ncbi:hypothetical protein F2P81_001576 [Scophthalmus maximus]|uniref:Uncharacterized protein n=1 Tax=Scophthalmus maximus TaxID=52904 RepID=A0A6A4TEL5_SCOMX|nr:hypothetical protein F2P81_001576 [Scophthalmus maximus]